MEKKVYGIYPGNLQDIQAINKLSETELFMAISSLDYYILAYKRVQVYNGGRSIDITEDEYALEYLINKTRNFGVELQKDERGKVIKIGDYAGWYQYHLTHFSKVLTKEEFDKFLDLKTKGYNVSRYLPEYSYLEYKKRMEHQNINNQMQHRRNA